MADNPHSLDQLRFMLARVQNTLEHPVQTFDSSRLAMLFTPERYQRVLDGNSEVALNPEALAERRGIEQTPGGADTPARSIDPLTAQGVEALQRLVNEVHALAADMRADATQGIRANEVALLYETQEFDYLAAEREQAPSDHREAAPGQGLLQENWDRPGSSYGLNQDSESGPEAYPQASERLGLLERLQVWRENQVEGSLYRVTLPQAQTTTLDTIEALQQQVHQLRQPELTRSQAHTRDQGMGL